jgi:hypothetical protein
MKLTGSTQNKGEKSIPKVERGNLEMQKENQRIPKNKILKKHTACKETLWQA